MTIRAYDTAAAYVLAALVCSAAYLASGCGASAIGRARSVVEYTAEAGAAADRSVADGYTAAAQRELGRAGSLREYREAMRKWDIAVAAVEALYEALDAAESAVDAWAAGKHEDWLGVAGCVLGALQELVAALDAVGVPVPEAALSAIRLIGTFADAFCARGEQ